MKLKLLHGLLDDIVDFKKISRLELQRKAGLDKTTMHDLFYTTNSPFLADYCGLNNIEMYQVTGRMPVRRVTTRLTLDKLSMFVQLYQSKVICSVDGVVNYFKDYINYMEDLEKLTSGKLLRRRFEQAMFLHKVDNPVYFFNELSECMQDK